MVKQRKPAKWFLSIAFVLGALAAPTVVAADPQFNVTVVDQRIRVQSSETESSCPVSSCTVDMLTVPDGKRLVIEYVSVLTQLYPGGNSAKVSIWATFDGKFAQIPVGTTTNTGTGINSQDVFAGPAKLYADGGSQVVCSVGSPNFEGFSLLRCTITGYLEDEH